MKDPLPMQALLVGHLIHELCGEACITGSSPLTKYFWNLVNKQKSKLSLSHQIIITKISSNDIDIFAPMNPRKLAHSRQLDEVGITEGNMQPAELRTIRNQMMLTSEKEFSFQDFDELLFQHHGYIITNHTSKDFDHFGIGENQYFPWNEGAHAGIRCIHNFKLSCLEEDMNFQLILIDAFPLPGETWHHFVTKRFDINIVTGHVEIGDVNTLGKLSFHPTVLDAIDNGVISYAIKPCVCIKTILKRIFKYKQRGFRLIKLSFHSECNKENQLLISRYLHHIFDTRLCMQWFEDAGTNQAMAGQVFDDYVSPCLHHYNPTWETSFLAMQQKNFYEYHCTNNWICPSLVKLSEEVAETCILQQSSWKAKKKLRKWFKKALLRKVNAAITIQFWWRWVFRNEKIAHHRHLKRQKVVK